MATVDGHEGFCAKKIVGRLRVGGSSLCPLHRRFTTKPLIPGPIAAKKCGSCSAPALSRRLQLSLYLQIQVNIFH
jgi:hypothetical protein